MQQFLPSHASSPRARSMPVFFALVLTALVAGVVRAQDVAAWGDQVANSAWNQQVVQVSAGAGHTAVRRSDGSVAAFGRNNYGQCSVPALLPGLTYVEVSAGAHHTVALRSDGSVVAWGWNQYRQTRVPAPPPGLTFAGISAGGLHRFVPDNRPYELSGSGR